MANDVRTQVTKRLLKDAFHSMIEKDMENEITVKSLCKMAQVSRVTFYTHYKDIYEMILEDKQRIFDFLELKNCTNQNDATRRLLRS